MSGEVRRAGVSYATAHDQRGRGGVRRRGAWATAPVEAVPGAGVWAQLGVLTALDLAGIPLLAADRTDDDPIVVAGGHAAFNPEPIADFVDAAVLGDGEEAALRISAIVRDWKAEGRPNGRDGLLLRLSTDGV